MTRTTWTLAFVILLLGGVAAWWLLERDDTATGPATKPAAVIETPADAGVADAGAIEDVSVRPSGEETLRARLSDRLAGSKSAAWVAAPGLLQRLTAAVWLVSQERSPRSVLGFVSIRGGFAVDETTRLEDPIYISPTSYRRYDRVAAALDEITAEGAAKIYRATKPSFAKSFSEVSSDQETFDDVLAKAIEHVLAVNVPKGQIEVKVKGGVFVYADPELESLSDAQKHLVRMGPKNAMAVQEFLRAFAAAVR